jgi:hypothetical protein
MTMTDIQQRGAWHCVTRLDKFDGDVDPDQATPVETIEVEGNILTYGGVSALWDTLIGAGTVTVFDNSNAYLGVGDSSTVAAAAQTALQAATNKLRVAMDGGYPDHTDGTGDGNHVITYRSTFATGQANFSWEEWGIFNHATAGRMLNRKVESLGVKTSAQTWTLTITVTIT